MPNIFALLKPVESNAEHSSTSPYVLCNEQNQQETLQQLGQLETVPLETSEKKRLHVGFSVWFNLDIIATTKPDYAVILDCDPSVHGFVYPALYNAIRTAKTREQFIIELLKNLLTNETLAPMIPVYEQKLGRMLNQNYGFLSTIDNFNYVKRMIEDENVFFGRGNLTSESDMGILASWMMSYDLKLATFYISNIAEWILQANGVARWESTQSMIKKLGFTPEKLIDAFYPTKHKGGEGPPQRVTSGSWPEFTLTSEQKINRKRKRVGLFDGSVDLPACDSNSNGYCVGSSSMDSGIKASIAKYN